MAWRGEVSERGRAPFRSNLRANGATAEGTMPQGDTSGNNALPRPCAYPPAGAPDAHGLLSRCSKHLAGLLGGTGPLRSPAATVALPSENTPSGLTPVAPARRAFTPRRGGVCCAAGAGAARMSICARRCRSRSTWAGDQFHPLADQPIARLVGGDFGKVAGLPRADDDDHRAVRRDDRLGRPADRQVRQQVAQFGRVDGVEPHRPGVVHPRALAPPAASSDSQDRPVSDRRCALSTWRICWAVGRDRINLPFERVDGLPARSAWSPCRGPAMRFWRSMAIT
jgi:hypothetical protein